jgi:hypothetical protein
MADNAIFCNNGVTTASINFSGQSIPLGSFITANETYNPDPLDDVNYCLQITGGDETTGLTATTSVFTSCYDCLVQNNTVVSFTDCVTSLGYAIELSQLGYIPVVDAVFNMTITNVGGRNSGTTSGCFYITEIRQTSTNEYNTLIEDFFTIDELLFSNYSLENGCNECLNGFSAGTESTICVVCCPCTTGETVTSVSAPHPTWTNGQGQAIVQLNAITLGGPNGLNN